MRSQKRPSLYYVLVVGTLLVLGFLFPPRLAAQFTTASLGGNVTDPSGAAVPGAKVTAQNTATGSAQTTSTNASGGYLFPRLSVGHYRLTVEKAGFTTYVQGGIVLTVNQAASQPVTLKVGAVTQEISVSANAELVQSRQATVGQLVNEASIVDLPLNGRDVQSLVFLAPGTTNVTAHYCALNCEGGVYPGEQYASVSGSLANGANYQLDGVDYNDTYLNSNLPFPNPDAVQEFNIQTANMSAEYGNAVGGIVNIVTKSGTNQIHGDAFEFLRNGDLNARNFFAPTQDTLKRNQFGGTIGGPIKKDRLFYFGTYQGTRTRTAPEGQIAFVPTVAERQGDFADLCPGGFNANGICPPSAGTQLVNPVSKAPFIDNQIPASPVSQFFLKYIPEPNGPGGQLTYVGPPAVQNDDQFMTKVNYISGKHQLSGRYFFSNFSQPPFIQKVNLLAASPDGNRVRVQNIGINYTYSANSNLLFNTWFGWNQENGGSLSGAPFGFPAAGVKIAAPPASTPPELVVGVTGYFNITTNHYGAFNRGDQTFREEISDIKGSHELHFGVEALRVRVPQANSLQQSGQFSFSSNLSNNDLADFIFGQASQFIQGGGIYVNLTGIKWSAFAQDNWRVNHRLTVNAGLRWDPYFPYLDSEDRLPCFVPGNKSVRYPSAPEGLLFGGDPGCPPGSTYSNIANFGPRLGFAYRLTENGKTSLRGGAGYYYQPPDTVVQSDVEAIPPFAPTISLTDVSFGDPYGSAGIPDPFPAGYGPRVPGPDATFPSDIGIPYILDRNFRLPQILVWNLTLERQIGKSLVIRAAYVGNKGTYLYGTNDQESGMQEVNPAIYIPGQSTIANTQQRRIYPDFAATQMITSGINSSYNAMQLNLEKYFSHGLSFLSNYTWSKQLNDFAPIGAEASNTDPFNRYFDYGPSDDDLSGVFKFSGSYQLPHPRIAGLFGKLLNGWQLNSILVWQGGFPFPVFSGYDNSFSGVGEDRADFVGTDLHAAQLSSSRPHGQQIQEWFDTSLFKPNAIGTFGNTGKNILRGPKLFNADFGLIKETRLTERTKLQFHAEFFNIFNNVNFAMPDHTVSDAAFGQITAAGDPRILQFALKLEF